MWYIIPHTKTKIIRHVHAAHGHTRRLFFWDVSIRNSLRSNKHTYIDYRKKIVFYFWHPMLVRPAMKGLFCLKAKNNLGRFAPSALPHFNKCEHNVQKS